MFAAQRLHFKPPLTAPLGMHPLDQMSLIPEVAATFKWLDPPNNEGRPRRWSMSIPKDIFEQHLRVPAWLNPKPVPRQRKKTVKDAKIGDEAQLRGPDADSVPERVRIG